MQTSALKPLALAVSAVMLAACGDSSDRPDLTPPPVTGEDFRQQVINAISHTETTHFNLTTGEIVDASAGGEWHIAFQRVNVKLNSGASGDGAVAGALGAAQAEFYDGDEPVPSVFLNASADQQLDKLLQGFSQPGVRDWKQDTIVNEFGASWYIYDYSSPIGQINPNPDNGWLVRSGTGDSYARVRVTELDFPTRTGNGIVAFTLSFDVQTPGASQFTQTASFTGSLPAAGELCFDFDANEAVECVGTAWDIKLGYSGRGAYLRTNSGPSGEGQGAAFGPFAWSDLQAYTSATTSPEGASLSPRYTPDNTGGIFVDQSWYAYGLQGGHQLWPNYRVYLIDTDANDAEAPVYALQIIGYYGADGVSGQPVIRWRQVEWE